MKGVVMGEKLYKGINFEYDQKKLEWLKNKYFDKNIAGLIKMRVSGFLASIELIENKNKMVKLDNIEKAISQDIKKMLLARKKSMIILLAIRATLCLLKMKMGRRSGFMMKKKIPYRFIWNISFINIVLSLNML